ncbi:MAG: hypothetical protein IKY43_07675 [Bacteroidales bacterium]|nr:hypothetical protein [Bacteroidales bacterium]
MNIKVERYKNNGRVVDGLLKINGKTICSTAENAEHCLVEGVYDVELHYCKQYHKRVLIVNTFDDSIRLSKDEECELCDQLGFVCQNTDLPSFCPMIKMGNGAYNRTDGSILVGEYIANGCLIHPKKYYSVIFDRVRKALKRGKRVKMKIC